MSVTKCLLSSKSVAAAALIAFGISATPVWGGVMITGDPTSTTGAGLNAIGNSQGSGLFAGSSGSGFEYDVYTGRYTVSGDDATSGANLIGNTGEGAEGGSFNVGDDIFVIGWKSTAQDAAGNLIASSGDNFLKLDPNGNAGYLPSSDPNGPVTSFSNSDAGDAQLQSSRNDGNEFRFRAFRFNDGSGSTIYPYQTDVNDAESDFSGSLANLPFRAFGVNNAGLKSNGQPETPAVTSQVYLLNVTDLNNSSFNGTDFNQIGQNLPFYMFVGNGSGKTGVVVPGAAAVPEPASFSLMLAGAGILSLGGLRRRRRDKKRAEQASGSV